MTVKCGIIALPKAVPKVECRHTRTMWQAIRRRPKWHVYAARITDAANTSSTTSGLLAMTSNSTRAAASG